LVCLLLSPPVDVAGGALGFEPRHVEDVAQRIEAVLAGERRQLRAQRGDIIRRRFPIPDPRSPISRLVLLAASPAPS
jgi:hypothetical protein